MLTIESTRMEDLARLQPAYPPRYWRGLVLQLARSVAWSIEDDGELLAIAGLYPDGPDFLELWLCIAPQVRGGAKARRLVRVLIRLAQDVCGNVPVAACVQRGHAPGLKLARLAGFREVGQLLDGRLVRLLRH